MAELNANGVRLYYEEHGRGDPILCIHGTSSSAMVWRPAAIDELSEQGRVILYDRRGCTRSERPDPYETSVVQQRSPRRPLEPPPRSVPCRGSQRDWIHREPNCGRRATTDPRTATTTPSPWG